MGSGQPGTASRGIDCPTRFLEDQPEKADDAFGSHRRIAAALAELIRTPSAALCIGLAGAWGSGKSTVIALLEAQCKSSEYVFWVFDAWAHEGDPLRRTFLESLIQTLKREQWLGTGAELLHWEGQLETLARRRKVTERRHAPTLTPIAALLATSLLFVPLGSTLFGTQIRSGIVLDRQLPVDRVAVLGLLLQFAPLLFVLVYSVWSLATPAPQGSTRGRRLREALTAFVHRNESESRTETLDSGDQTSLEFEATFTRLMQSTLGRDLRRRLVLVIDNLDRIGAAQALSIWSTLQTFLRPAEPAPEWRKQLWCVLPFDPTAIRRLWEQTSAPGSALAASFLDKTFQVRFEVPLPRLSSWKNYLIGRLGQALPRHSEDEFFRIYRLMTLLRADRRWPEPTPRELTLFVNQVASLHAQWRHEIPLQDLAYFVLLRREDKPVVSDFLKGLIPSPNVLGLVSDQIGQHLAALTYGVAAEASHELLLRQPILAALEQGEPASLTELARRSDRFWDVLEIAVEEGCHEWPGAEGGRLLHAAAALQKSNLGEVAPARRQALFRRLVRAAQQTQTWAPHDNAAVTGILALFEMDPTLAFHLFRGFMDFHGKRQDANADVKRLAGWYFQVMQAFEGQEIGSRRLLIGGGLGQYADAVDALVDVDREGLYWQFLHPTGGAEALAELTTALPIARWPNIARVACAAGQSRAPLWSQVVVSAKKTAREEETQDSGIAALATLHALAARTDATETIEALARQQRATDLALENQEVDGSIDGAAPLEFRHAAAWLLTILRVFPTFLGEPGNLKAGATSEAIRVSASQKDALITWRSWGPRNRALAEMVLEMGDASVLFDVAENDPGSALGMYGAVFELARLQVPRRVLPLERLTRRWEAAFGGYTRYEIVRNLMASDMHLERALATEPFDPRLMIVYAGVFEANRIPERTFTEFCTQGLLRVDSSVWAQRLNLEEASQALRERLHQDAVWDPRHKLLTTRFWKPLFGALSASQRHHVLVDIGQQLLQGMPPAAEQWFDFLAVRNAHEFWRSLPAAALVTIIEQVIYNPSLQANFSRLMQELSLRAPDGSVPRLLKLIDQRLKAATDDQHPLSELRGFLSMG